VTCLCCSMIRNEEIAFIASSGTKGGRGWYERRKNAITTMMKVMNEGGKIYNDSRYNADASNNHNVHIAVLIFFVHGSHDDVVKRQI
jgi:hypothetical protein